MLVPRARALAPRSVRAIAIVFATAALASWLVDGVIAWASSGRDRSFADALLRPTFVELWTRLLVAVLLVLLHRFGSARHRLHLLSSALAKAPDGVQITTLEGRVAYSNDAVREIYGFSPDELLGKHVDEMNADPAFASGVILPALVKEGRWEGELEVKHKDGHTFPIWLTTSLVRDRRRRPLAAIGVIRDMSERKRSEQALREYARRLEDATALKDLFADILRHDLLGPAATVQLSLDSLLGHEPEPDVARRILEGARRSCAKLIDMIDGAARYAKLSTAQDIEFGTIELGALLKEIVADSALRREARNARVVLEVDGEHRVRANAMIADVFENLVSNALKYGPVDGTIRVEVRDEGERCRVSVADRGEGIADDDKHKIFTRFERLRKDSVKGTGLGLAIAKRIVDLHGGSIWVEDNPGGGSVFCVALPKAPAEVR
jgi:PAS domain S-box-containing protein